MVPRAADRRLQDVGVGLAGRPVDVALVAHLRHPTRVAGLGEDRCRGGRHAVLPRDACARLPRRGGGRAVAQEIAEERRAARGVIALHVEGTARSEILEPRSVVVLVVRHRHDELRDARTEPLRDRPDATVGDERRRVREHEAEGNVGFVAHGRRHALRHVARIRGHEEPARLEPLAHAERLAEEARPLHVRRAVGEDDRLAAGVEPAHEILAERVRVGAVEEREPREPELRRPVGLRRPVPLRPEAEDPVGRVPPPLERPPHGRKPDLLTEGVELRHPGAVEELVGEPPEAALEPAGHRPDELHPLEDGEPVDRPEDHGRHVDRHEPRAVLLLDEPPREVERRADEDGPRARLGDERLVDLPHDHERELPHDEREPLPRIPELRPRRHLEVLLAGPERLEPEPRARDRLLVPGGGVERDVVAALAQPAPDGDERVDVPRAPERHDRDAHGAASWHAGQALPSPVPPPFETQRVQSAAEKMRRTVLAVALASLLIAGCESARKESPPPQPPDKPVTPIPEPAPVTTIDPSTCISETVFANGLTLLVAPQKENPVVSCQIWYRVGSRDENKGETGLSHFLEHMLFKGTDRYKKGDIDKITQRNGGTNNASTWNDLTEYHFTFPADRWEAALEIESNRMRNSAFAPDEFDSERKVVLEELKIGKDDPENVLWEQVESAAFPVSGYHHPVIGWEEEVTNVPRETVKGYYLRHYTPDRATIVVAGGVDRDRVVARVGELFGKIPRGDVKRGELKEPLPLGETRLTLKQDTEVPRLLVTFRSMPVSDPREPLLDLLRNLLAEGKSSRLEKGLVETGIAATIECSNDARRDDGLFSILVEPAPEKTLDETEAALFKLLDGFDPTQKELDRARAQLLAGLVFQRESAYGWAMRLGQMSAMATWRYVLSYPAALEKATPEALRDLARGVFQRDRAVVGRSIPKEEGKGPGGGETRESHRRRSRGRDDGAATVSTALDLKPARVVLDNGLTVLVLERKANPVFTAQLYVKNGRLCETAPGLHAFTAALLEEGTKRHAADEIADAIGAVGGTLEAGGDGVSIRVLSKDAALGLGLMAEVAREPAFAPDAVERVRAQQLAAIKVELDTPRAVAQAKFQEAVYGAGHPLGRSANGTEASVQAITGEEIAAHHAALFVPSNAILAIVTDLPADAALKLARDAFGSWPKAPTPFPAPPDPKKREAKTIREKAEKRQVNIFVGQLGIVRTDPDFVALEVMDNVFGTGAGFTDRLSKNIRDEKGLAYTVFGNITSTADVAPGTFRVYCGTSPESADLALAEMKKEILAIRDVAPTPDELSRREGGAARRHGLPLRDVPGPRARADPLRAVRPRLRLPEAVPRSARQGHGRGRPARRPEPHRPLRPRRSGPRPVSTH